MEGCLREEEEEEEDDERGERRPGYAYLPVSLARASLILPWLALPCLFSIGWGGVSGQQKVCAGFEETKAVGREAGREGEALGRECCLVLS